LISIERRWSSPSETLGHPPFFRREPETWAHDRARLRHSE
jgi:hypothetical protein